MTNPATSGMLLLCLLAQLVPILTLEDRNMVILNRQYEYDEPPSQIVHPNLGTVFRYKGKIIEESNIWLHAYKLDLIDFDKVYDILIKYNASLCARDLKTQITLYFDNCNFFSDILGHSHNFSRHLVSKIKHNIDFVHNVGISPKSDPKRSIFNIGLIDWLFPVASKKDLKATFERLQLLERHTMNITKDLGTFKQDFMSFIKINDKRFDNVIDTLSSHDNMLANISQDLHDLATLREHDNRRYKRQFMQNSKFTSLAFTQIPYLNEILLDVYQTSNEIKLGLQSLLEGKITSHLISESTLRNTIRQVSDILDKTHPGFRLMYTTASDLYTHALAIGHITADNILHILLHLPLKSENTGFDIYHLELLPLPVILKNESNSQVIGNTIFESEFRFIAVNHYSTKYIPLTLDALQDCNSRNHLFTCSHLSIIKQFDTQPICISSLFKGDMNQIKDNCLSKFHKTSMAEEYVTALGPSKFLITSQPDQEWYLKCKELTVKQTSCPHCIVSLKCNCRLTTKHWTIESSISMCDQSTTLINMSHALNYPMLMHYFSENELMNFTNQNLYDTPLDLETPFNIPADIVHHDVAGVDRKYNTKTEHIAKSLRFGTASYETLAQKLANFQLNDINESKSDHWVPSFVMLALSIFQWGLIIYMFYKIRLLNAKVNQLIIGGIAAVHKVDAWTIPTENQQKIVVETKEAEMSLFKIMILTMLAILISKLLFRLVKIAFRYIKNNLPTKVKINGIKTKISLELTDNYSSAIIFLTETPLHERYLTMSRIDDRISMQIERTMLGGILHINWNSYAIEVNETINLIPLPETISLNFLQVQKLDHLIKNHIKADIITSYDDMYCRHNVRIIKETTEKMSLIPRMRTISM